MLTKRECKFCLKVFLYQLYPSRIKFKNEGVYCSQKCHYLNRKNIPFTKERKEIWRKAQIGRKHSEKSKKQRSNKMKLRYKLKLMPNQSKEKNPNWKGGYRHYNPIRSSGKYKKFRARVLKRDKKCVLCLSTERLEVDHIKRFSEYPELRLRLKNARVLCHECHKKTDTYGNRMRNIK